MFLASFVVFCEFFVVALDCFKIILIVLCWFGLFSAVQPIFKSCQRAERRERSERCEAPGLLLVIFLLFFVVSNCFWLFCDRLGCFRLWEGLGASWVLVGAPRAVVYSFS